MPIRKRNKQGRRQSGSGGRANEGAATSEAELPEKVVPEIYQVVIECRHEREQRAVFERMRAEGFQCRVLTL